MFKALLLRKKIKNFLNSKKSISNDDEFYFFILDLFKQKKKIKRYIYLYISLLNKIIKIILSKNNLIFSKKIFVHHYYFFIFMTKYGNIQTFYLIKKWKNLLKRDLINDDLSDKLIFLNKNLKILKSRISFLKKKKNIKFYSFFSIIRSWYN